MTWLAVLLAIAVVVIPLLRRRGSRDAVLLSGPLSTMNLEMSKRDKKKRAALDAATQVLR
jgi:hypothetical protein